MTYRRDDILTCGPAAAILGVAPATVIYLHRIGRLRGSRTSTGIRLFLRADVEQLAAERRAQGRRQ